ncbi:hypothetical protein [Sphingobium sp. EM0848]|uniref:hypothetical protein n=1 Tax=Sphingobium sp. EM0848 TaxID=2743473 RepID=UPI00159C7DC7|nr:hypothetical protein [Sphingobium sp. EM0848]
MMAAPGWNYPALLAIVGARQKPDRAALRILVRRLRREAFPGISEPAQSRQHVRLAINIILTP